MAFTKWNCISKTLFENSEVYVIIRSIVAEIRNIFSVILDSVECFSHSIYLHIGTVALLCFATYIALCHFLIFYVEKRWQLMEPSKVISFPVHCGLMVGKNHVFNYCHRRYAIKGQLVLKCLFGVFNFLQKTNENKSTWVIIVVKSNLFVRFFGWIQGLTICLRVLLTFKRIILKDWER